MDIGRIGWGQNQWLKKTASLKRGSYLRYRRQNDNMNWIKYSRTTPVKIMVWMNTAFAAHLGFSYGKITFKPKN